MRIKYPSTVVTPSEKTAFLYRLYELLRLRHNEEGAKLKNSDITNSEWKIFLEWFDKRHELFVTDVLEARKQLKEDKTISIDLNAVFME